VTRGTRGDTLASRGGKTLVAFKGHFDGKVIVPDEPLDLRPNEPLIVRIEPAAPEAPQHATDRDLGEGPNPGESFLEWAARNPLPADTDLPADLSENLDHYLYGTPKRQPE
jgi:hypothetical protein